MTYHVPLIRLALFTAGNCLSRISLRKETRQGVGDCQQSRLIAPNRCYNFITGMQAFPPAIGAGEVSTELGSGP